MREPDAAAGDPSFDEEGFYRVVALLRTGSLPLGGVEGAVEPASERDVEPWPAPGSRRHEALSRRGEEALASGRVASVVVAGGAGTRFGGAVKALVPVLGERTFLDLKLEDARRTARRHGREIPLAVMTSAATQETIARRLAGEPDAIVFRQRMLPRLTEDLEVLRDEDGARSLAPAGHGDFFRALRESGVGAELARRGVRLVYFTNVDNLAATLDPVIFGAHLALGAAMTVEVADRRGPEGQLDTGAAPVRAGGRLRLVEHVDPAAHPFISTNNIVFDLGSLLDRELPLPWRVVRKEVGGRTVVQLEQVTGEVTGLTDAEGRPLLPCAFLAVPRADPAATRFEPVKARQDLERVARRLAARFSE